MSSTAMRLQRLPLLLALACILSMTGCKTSSSKHELPQLRPEPVEVRCKQPAAPALPVLPKADKWVEWRPTLDGQGTARLSKQASDWTLEMLGVYRASESLRGVEHKCLDALEAKGLIRQ